jgi:hypothetical protein
MFIYLFYADLEKVGQSAQVSWSVQSARTDLCDQARI